MNEMTKELTKEQKKLQKHLLFHIDLRLGPAIEDLPVRDVVDIIDDLYDMIVEKCKNENKEFKENILEIYKEKLLNDRYIKEVIRFFPEVEYKIDLLLG